MPQLTPAQARVVDPILSTIARGYQNAELIGTKLFPFVPVPQRGGKIISFRKEDFRLYATGRAPGANTKRIQVGYDGSNYALESHSLEGLLPIELMQEANAVPGVDLAQGTIRKTQNIIALRLEKAQADLATTAANYPAGNKTTLAGASQWSDFTGTSDPLNDVEVAKEAIRKAVGKRPNTIAMGAAVMAKLRLHPKIIDRMKYTGRDVPTAEILAALWGVQNVVVGDAVYADDADAITDVWGKFVVVAFTETASLAAMGTPSYGYTYRLSGYPMVETPYLERNPKSWVYPVTDEVVPVIAGATAGYLISAAVA